MKLLHENQEVITDQDDEIGFLFDGNLTGPFSGELKCTGLRSLNLKFEKLTFIVHTNTTVDDECNFTFFFLINYYPQ